MVDSRPDCSGGANVGDCGVAVDCHEQIGLSEEAAEDVGGAVRAVGLDVPDF